MSAASFRRGRSAQYGQSLVEMAVLCALLVPMFLLVPLLGKYIHIRQATQQAARAAVWEATVASDYAIPDPARVGALMIDRHFADADAPIRTTASTGNAQDRVGNALLNTHADRPLVRRGDVRTQAYENNDDPAIVNKVSGILSGLPGDFPPNKKGLVTSHLEVTVQDIRNTRGGASTLLEPFDSLGLVMQGSNTLLADPWNAAGATGSHPRSVISQVRTLTAGSLLKPASDALDAIPGWIPIIGELSNLDFGYIEPNVVPPDKLQRYAQDN